MRRYGRWAGNPRGSKENPEKCIASVFPTGRWWWHAVQCTRKRGHGPRKEYCWQHARMLGDGSGYVHVPDDVEEEE